MYISAILSIRNVIRYVTIKVFIDEKLNETFQMNSKWVNSPKSCRNGTILLFEINAKSEIFNCEYFFFEVKLLIF